MKHAFTLFSDYFALRDNWLTRQDPRVKMPVAVGLILAILLSSRPPLPVVVFCLAVVAMLSIRIPLKMLLVRFVPVVGILFLLVVLRSFLVGSTPLHVFHVAGRELVMTREGVQEAALIGSRALGALSVVILSSFITPAPQLYAALLWFRMPRLWVEIASMVYRYLFVILEGAGSTILAQRSRLGYTGPARSLNSVGILAGTVFLRAFEQAERTHRAMVARGYNGTMPTGELRALNQRHLWRLVACALVILGAYLAAERVNR